MNKYRATRRMACCYCQEPILPGDEYVYITPPHGNLAVTAHAIHIKEGDGK